MAKTGLESKTVDLRVAMELPTLLCELERVCVLALASQAWL